MNKLLKYGLAILLIGFGIVVIVSITSNSSIISVNEEKFTFYEESYSFDEFSLIDFEFDNRSVYILESPDESVYIEYYVHEKDEYEMSDSNNELMINISRKWYFSIFIFDIFQNMDFYKVYLYLPANNTVEDLDIISSNGSISIDLNHTFDSIFISTSNGRIDLDNFLATNIIANSSNGTIDVNSLSVTNKISLKTSNGSILIDDSSALIIDGKTSNGAIEAKNIISDDINLDTSNGKIYLSVKGEKDDYRVTLQTSLGDSIYDGLKVESGTINNTGEKLISISSSNGDIEVDFIN